MKERICAVLLLVTMLLTVASCASGSPAPPSPETSPVTDSDITEPPDRPSVNISMDRDGNPIVLPETIEKVISMGPSNTEIFAALGFAEKLIAVDEYSDNIPGVDPSIAIFDMMNPDAERIISMMPDVIFSTAMSMSGGMDPYRIIADAGICVIYIPSSTSIEAIKEDIRFFAAVMDAQEKGEELVAEMEEAIDGVMKIGETISDKKTVYFELSAAPHMYSFGKGSFLHEIIEIIGAVNIFGDFESWISVSDEIVIDADPDVILTSVNYIENPVGEIVSRQGWGDVTAVKNGDVYYISTDASNRPSQNVVKAMLEMAKAIYPEIF